MKKVLIVTYYWPPAGGAGVQRWLKMSKYLPESGWMPVIYTPEITESPADDHTLMEDIRDDITVIKTPIWEPYQWYKRFVGKGADERINAGFLHEGKPPALAERISIWIRGNLFIPDARRFWIRPSVRYLLRYLRENPVDAIITTGPPHSMHLIGLGIKRKLHIPWIADFRDPWTQIDYYHRLKLTRMADRIHHRQEHQVLTSADQVMTIGWSSREDLMALGAKRVEVVTNGYDHEDFVTDATYNHQAFSITHVGVMNEDRNPVQLWEALREVLESVPEFRNHLKIRLIGRVDFNVTASLKLYGLDLFVERIPYLPHKEAIAEMASSAVLLLSINQIPNARGILTGKLFEYLAVKRPVLCIANMAGDSAKVLEETGAGVCAGYAGAVPVREEVERLFGLYLRKALFLPEGGLAEGYSRKEQAEKTAKLLNACSGG
jgi:glycosyltransferase involved in cell wall biosynthesis